MSQTKAQLLDNIKDNVQLDARNSLRFADTDSSHYVAFKAPATVSSNVTWTLPAADGSANYVLATDGSGTLSWIADPAGQWTTSGSNIYFTGGNVGIGDSSPSNPLSVTGVSVFNGDVTFTGASYNVTWDKSADDLIFNDNAKAAFGTGSDLQIYATGSNSTIAHNGDGHLIISTAAGEKIYFDSSEFIFRNAASDENLIKATENGAVEIYHNNVKLFETQTSGLKSNIAGSNTFTIGSTNASGAYLVLDGDSNGDGTGADYASIIHGTDGDLSIHADNPSGDSQFELYVGSGATTAIVAQAAGAVQLYWNGSLCLETKADGLRLTDSSECNFYLEGTVDGVGGGLLLWNKSDTANSKMRIQNLDAGGQGTSEIGFCSESNANNEGYLYLGTRPSGGSMTERMRVDSDGKVGIGTTSPSELLHINSAATTNGLLISSTNNSTRATMELNGKDSSGNQVELRLGGFGDTNRGEIFTVTNHAIGFATNNAAPQMILTTTGRIGIGTTTPATVLEIKSGMNSDGLSILKGSNSSVFIGHNGSGDEGLLQLKDGGTTTIQIYAETGQASFFNAGNVGIGTASPTGIHNLAKVLEISGGDGGDLIIGNNASSNIGAGAHIGAIAFKNIDNSTGSTPHYAGIRCEAADTSGNMDLRFYTGISTLESDNPQVYINSTGKVGINTTTPGCHLHVKSDAADDALKLESTDNAVNLILTDAAGSSSIQQNNDMLNINSDPGSTVSASTIRFNIDGVNVGTFLNNQFRLGTNSSGIQFHGDTAAANSLDDYEEGTYTPVVTFDSTNNHTYSEQLGHYTKIGNLVTGTIVLTMDKQASGGSFRVSLPIVSSNASGTRTSGYFTYQHGLDMPDDQGSKHLILYGGQNSTAIYAYFVGGNENSELGTGATHLTAAYMSSANTLRMAFTYRTDAT